MKFKIVHGVRRWNKIDGKLHFLFGYNFQENKNKKKRSTNNKHKIE